MRVCLEPDCPNPAVYRGRCSQHARRRDQNIQRAGWHIYRTVRWHNTRRAYLLDHPVCERCDQRLATDVHHKIDLADGGDPWNPDLLESLCKSCHARETRHRQITSSATTAG